MSARATELISPVSAAVRHFASQVSGRRVLVGYSGGVDSHAFLFELEKVASMYEITMVALHGNHQQASKANAWEQHCRDVCEDIDVQFQSYRLDIDFGVPGGKENALREARYAWFETLMNPGDVLVTAHHLDDQVETVLFRLFRGSGLRGLTGIPSFRKFASGELHRPFRDIWRSEIVSFARQHNLNWIEDLSNQDESIDRNFLRERVIPILRSRWPGSSRAIARASRHLANAEILLGEIGDEDLKDLLIIATECRFTNFGKIEISVLNTLSRQRATNVLRCWSRRVSWDIPGANKMLELLRQVDQSNSSRQARLVWKHGEFRQYRDWLYLLPPQREPVPDLDHHWMLEIPVDLPAAGVRLRACRRTGQGMRMFGATAQELQICGYNQKIGLRLTSRSRTKTLRNLFQERGIPPWERWRLPVLRVDDSVVYALGIGVAADFAAQSGEPGIEFILEEK